jgi:hypothetical protein
MATNPDDDLIARLRMALNDASAYPEGDLVRNMAEEVAAGDLQELVERDGLSGVRCLEEELDAENRNVLRRLALAMIGSKRASHGLLTEFMPVMCITLLNESSNSIVVCEGTWQDLADAIRGCLEREMDPHAVRVEMEWVALNVEQAGLESATSALETYLLSRREATSQRQLRPGRNRVLFGPRMLAVSTSTSLDAEWDRKAQRVQQSLRAALASIAPSLRRLGESITITATPLLPLESFPGVLLCQWTRDGEQSSDLNLLGPLFDDGSQSLNEAKAVLDRFRPVEK